MVPPTTMARVGFEVVGMLDMALQTTDVDERQTDRSQGSRSIVTTMKGSCSPKFVPSTESKIGPVTGKFLRGEGSPICVTTAASKEYANLDAVPTCNK
jgi:hypothetical protein